MKPNVFIFLIYILGICSCSVKIELDIPDSPPQIVVNSLITKDSLITVNISKTVPMLSEGVSFVNNAEVELLADGSFIENLHQKETGIYQSTITPQTGINYQIYIDVPGFNRMSSSANIPEPITITEGTIKVDSYYDQQQMQSVSEVEISFYDPPQIENYYQISFYSYSFGGYAWDTLTNTFIVTDSTRYYAGISYLNSKDPIIISEGDLQYYIDPGRIRSFVFSDKLLDKNSSVKFLVGGIACNDCPTGESCALLRNISYDYYKYHKSWVRQAFNQGIGNFDATNMFLVNNPNDLYSNIENGLGIFAGYSETHFELEVIE